jgi:hypothetical protein
MLSACAAGTSISGTPSPGLPTAPPRTETAPAVARQLLQDEPLPPPGVGAAALREALGTSLDAATADALYKWLTVDEPEWGREGWRRAQEMSRVLLEREQQTTPATPKK